MKIFHQAKKNKGMTYVELIVVLSIFAVISAVSFYNYGTFQANIDIKNLASDIALRIVQAQKSSLDGLQNPSVETATDWKPSYGVYFDTSTKDTFTYFTDLDGGGYSAGDPSTLIVITKDNKISGIDRCSSNPCVPNPIKTLSISFQRPNSEAIFYADSSFLSLSSNEYLQITVTTPQEKPFAFIKIYPSGRIETD